MYKVPFIDNFTKIMTTNDAYTGHENIGNRLTK